MKTAFKLLIISVLLLGTSFAQSKMSATVNAGVSLPMGDFGTAFGTGWGLDGTFLYSLQPNLDLTGTIGYHKWSAKETSDVTFSTVPVLVGVQYSFGSSGGFTPYGMAKLGLHFATVGASVLGVSLSSSENDFGFLVGAGVLIPVGTNMNVDVNASFNSISTSGSATNYVDVKAGVNFGL